MEKQYLKYGLYSNQGVRKENQDFVDVFMLEDLLVMVAADGVGGLHHGKAAATMAVEAIRDELTGESNTNIDYISSLLIIKIKQINDFIYKQSVANKVQMGTTLSILLISQNKYVSINVGDTMALKVSGGSLEVISQVHTLAAKDGQYKITSLDHYVKEKNTNMLTRAVGVASDVEASVNTGGFYKSDCFVLCTDGVYNFINHKKWLELINISNTSDLNELCSKIAQLSIKNGSKDNVSLVIAHFMYQ